MNKPKYDQTDKVKELVRFVPTDIAVARYGIGRTTLVKIAKNNGAFYRIGRCARFDVQKLDKVIEQYEVM